MYGSQLALCKKKVFREEKAKKAKISCANESIWEFKFGVLFALFSFSYFYVPRAKKIFLTTSTAKKLTYISLLLLLLLLLLLIGSGSLHCHGSEIFLTVGGFVLRASRGEV